MEGVSGLHLRLQKCETVFLVHKIRVNFSVVRKGCSEQVLRKKGRFPMIAVLWFVCGLRMGFSGWEFGLQCGSTEKVEPLRDRPL